MRSSCFLNHASLEVIVIVNAGFTEPALVTGHLHHTAGGAWFLSSLSAMFFHWAVKATVLNQATPLYAVERESSFHSACSDVEVNKTEVNNNNNDKKKTNLVVIKRQEVD